MGITFLFLCLLTAASSPRSSEELCLQPPTDRQREILKRYVSSEDNTRPASNPIPVPPRNSYTVPGVPGHAALSPDDMLDEGRSSAGLSARRKLRLDGLVSHNEGVMTRGPLRPEGGMKESQQGPRDEEYSGVSVRRGQGRGREGQGRGTDFDTIDGGSPEMRVTSEGNFILSCIPVCIVNFFREEQALIEAIH